MIRKIVSIRNCGNFINYTGPINKAIWDGSFSKVNTVFAENGSGKTTLTQILKSLSSNECSLVSKRKSLNGKGGVEVTLIDSNNKQHKLSKGAWNATMPKINVFDFYYAEQNVYSISLGTYDAPGIFYDIVPDGKALITAISELRHKRSKLSNYISSNRNKIKKTTDKDKVKILEIALGKQIAKREAYVKEIEDKTAELKSRISAAAIALTDKININLSYFSPSLRIDNLRHMSNQIVYDLYVRGKALRTKEIQEIPLKHTLSEGDKSAMSLSFFLAYIESLPDLAKHIIVFDDPISSFDSRRRMATVARLAEIAKRCNQFFLLSHDMNFVSRFAERFSKDLTTMKIEFVNNSSQLCYQDIKAETMTGLTRDICALNGYLDHGCDNDGHRRNIARIIRPVLEGIFRIKFVRLVSDDQWLGDFIGMIRNSNQDSPLHRLQSVVRDLSMLNDYSKRYHHSNPNYMDEPISDYELRTYVELTFKTIEVI